MNRKWREYLDGGGLLSRTIEFWWTKPPAGFQWIATHPSGNYHPDHGFLVLRIQDNAENAEQWQGTMEQTSYQPNRALFKNFAETKTSPEAMLEFANHYGSLWGDHGESQSAWIHQIELMRHALTVWEAIKREDALCLAQFVRWHDPPRA